MRAAAACLIALMPGAAMAEAWHDLGQTGQCGSYEEADFTEGVSWFPGGEGGTIALADPRGVSGLDATLYMGELRDEGFADPAGRVLAVTGPLRSAGGVVAEEVLVIVTGDGIRLLQRCP